jgi:hypothetical protein
MTRPTFVGTLEKHRRCPELTERFTHRLTWSYQRSFAVSPRQFRRRQRRLQWIIKLFNSACT